MNEENKEQLLEKLPSDEEMRGRIEARAYEIYLSRGSEPGREVEDWLQAESEILATRAGGESVEPGTEGDALTTRVTRQQDQARTVPGAVATG